MAAELLAGIVIFGLIAKTVIEVMLGRRSSRRALPAPDESASRKIVVSTAPGRERRLFPIAEWLSRRR
jgi:hypothetical protein